MRINNNIAALNTYRQYTSNTNSTNKSMEKLSSGLRINRAGDDAAGLAISEKMRAQIRGIKMAAKNSQDAISLVQTAEGALTETHSILQRMRELAVQSSSDTNETVDRSALQAEFAQLQKEIDDIAGQTKFNNMALLDGTYCGTKINANSSVFTDSTAVLKATDVKTVGNAKAGEYSAITYTAAADAGTAKSVTDIGAITISDTAKTGVYTISDDGAGNYSVKLGEVALTDVKFDGTAKTLTFGGITVNLGTSAAGALDGKTVDVTAATVAASYTDGTDTVALSSTFNADGSATLKDADGISYGITLTEDAIGCMTTATPAPGALVVDGTGSQLTIQTGANKDETLGVTIDAMDTATLKIDTTKVGTIEDAQAAIDSVNEAINTVSTQRAALGAYQNRLEHKINNLNTSSENLQAAESRIRDIDMAQEMVEFTKNNILLQAAQSMLSQANAQPQGVLQLLR